MTAIALTPDQLRALIEVSRAGMMIFDTGAPHDRGGRPGQLYRHARAARRALLAASKPPVILHAVLREPA